MFLLSSDLSGVVGSSGDEGFEEERLFLEMKLFLELGEVLLDVFSLSPRGDRVPEVTGGELVVMLVVFVLLLLFIEACPRLMVSRPEGLAAAVGETGGLEKLVVFRGELTPLGETIVELGSLRNVSPVKVCGVNVSGEKEFRGVLLWGSAEGILLIALIGDSNM